MKRIGLTSYAWIAGMVFPVACRDATPPEKPVPVTFTSITVGSMHTCGLGVDSLAYCWGHNTSGAVGDSSTSDRVVPVPVARRIRFVSIAAGSAHTCGVAATGNAYCWGANESGQLGLATPAGSTYPLELPSPASLVSVAAGSSHTCALTSNGDAWCWGKNDDGQLGDGTTTSRVAPAIVAGGLTFTSLAAGTTHTCAIAAGGAGYCWGRNATGALGDSSLIRRTTPVLVRGGLRFTSVSAGTDFSCGVATSARVYCWGSNAASKLGDGNLCDQRYPAYPCSELYRMTPDTVASRLTFSALDNGSFAACAIAVSGAGWCWGDNVLSVLGLGWSSMQEPTPRPITGGLALSQLSVGPSHACALTLEGNAYCWGGAGFGIPLLGNAANPEDSDVPLPVTMPSRAK